MLSIGDDLSVRAIVNSTALHNAAYALKPSSYLPLINSAVDNGESDQQGSSKRDISCAKPDKECRLIEKAKNTLVLSHVAFTGIAAIHLIHITNSTTK
jgi:hypothetical protein